MSYAEKIKDPRWQKRRLQVLSYHNWECDVCGSTTRTLHVHHLKYHANPWDTPMEELEVLCEKCHEKITWIYRLILPYMKPARHTLAPATLNLILFLGHFEHCSQFIGAQAVIDLCNQAIVNSTQEWRDEEWGEHTSGSVSTQLCAASSG